MTSKSRLTRADLSRRWGVSRQAVTALLVKPGAPIPDAEGRVSVAAAERFRKARAAAREDGGRWRREIYRLRAALLEIELAEMTKGLIPVADVQAQAKQDAAVIVQSLREMPDRLAPAIVGLNDVHAVQSVLNTWARATLQGWYDSTKGATDAL